MKVDKLVSVPSKLTVYKERFVDLLVYAHPRILNLLDVEARVQLPELKKFDTVITPFRQVEYMDDPFDTHKEDTPSFFESYESDENGIVNSDLLSTDLKALAPLSKRLRKPIGRFHTLHTISEQYTMTSDSDKYVAMLPKDFRLLTNMSDYFPNFWITVLKSTNKVSHFIDYSSSKTPHIDALRQFDFTMGNIEIYQEHLSDCATIPTEGDNDERLLVSYSALLFVPYLRSYQFGIGAGSSSNADELVEIYIDDENVVSSYSYKQGQQLSKEMILSEGFHTLNVVRLFRVGNFQHKSVFGKQGSVQFNLELSDISSKTGIEVYSPSFLFNVDDLESFIIYPLDVFSNEISIMIQKYLPVTILSSPDKSEMLAYYQNNYNFTPDNLVTIACDFNKSSAFNKITYHDPNQITKTDATKPSIITFQYKDAMLFNSVTLYDSSQTKNKFKFLKLRVFDSVGNLKDTAQLLQDFDYDNSFNVKSIRAEFGWLIVDRADTRYPIQIKFKSTFKSIGLDMSLPITDKYQLDEVVVGAIKYPNFVVATQSGKFYDLNQIDYQRMQEVTTEFDEIVAIPELFKHVELPRDIKNSSDFVIFALRDYDPLNIKLLGTAFDIWNKDKVKHTEHRYMAVHNLWANKFQFNIYSNWDKSQLFDWNHVVYDNSTSKIKVDGLDTLTVTITNTTDSDISNGVFLIQVPHYEHAWKGSVSGNSVPVVGADLDNQGKPSIYKGNYDGWNSYYVAAQLSVSAGSSVDLLLESGDFSATTSVTGNVVPSTSYFYSYDKADTSVVVADAGEWAPNSLKTVYVLTDTTVTKSSTITNDRELLTMYQYEVVNVTGDPVKSEFLLDMSAFRKMYGYHVPFKLVDATTYEPIDFLYRNEVNSYTKYFSQWTGDSVAVRWNYPPNLMQQILKKYADSGFKKYVDLEIDGWEYEGYQKDAILFLRYAGTSGHPSNHDALVNDYKYTTLQYKGTRQDIDTGNYGDYYDMFFCTWLYVQDSGTWDFAVDSDDASEVEIDGTIVAGWYGGHGVCNCQSHNGTISLSKGFHKIIVRHEEDTGGDWARLWFKSPSMTTWQKFTVTNLQGKGTCYAKVPDDTTVKTLDFIKNGLVDKPQVAPVKLHFDNTIVDFSVLNTDISNIDFVSDLLTEYYFKVENADSTNQTFDVVVYPKDTTLSIDDSKFYVVYGGYTKPVQNDALQDPSSTTTFTVNGNGDLIPPDVTHRHEGTKLLVLPGQYTTQQEDAYTLPYIDKLQQTLIDDPCSAAECDYSNYQNPILFYDHDDISYVPDKDGRESEAIELHGESYFEIPRFKFEKDTVLEVRYKTDTRTINNHSDLIATYEVNNVLMIAYTDTMYLPSLNYSDYYGIVMWTYLDVEKDGLWKFSIAGDDIVELEIDGKIIASGYNGTCCQWRSGSISLSKGKHLVIVRHKEYTGGDWVELKFQAPGMSSYIPFNVTNLRGYGTCWFYKLPETYVQSRNFINTGVVERLDNWSLSMHIFSVRKAKQLLVNENFELYIDDDGCVVLGAGDNFAKSDVNVVDGLWHHIVISRHDGSSLLFVDGIATIANSVALPTVLDDFFFGKASTKDYLSGGRFDEIRLYDRALSIEEIFVLKTNLKVEFVPPDVKLIPTIPDSIDYPTSIVTSLIDLKDKTGTAVILHKYRNIPTIVVELLSNIFSI